MLEKPGKFFDKQQLSNKWESMKRDWKLYDRLMRLETGIGGTRSLIDASEESWAKKINVNKDFSKFKDTNLDIYATHYAPLFQDSVDVRDHTMTLLQFQGGENMEGKGDSDEINLAMMMLFFLLSLRIVQIKGRSLVVTIVQQRVKLVMRKN
ncbi:hypothetical protein LXL04_025849 [Taraxacum kok-saghyz]